ncbi:alpha-L-rhamnosidase [Planctomycetota bacterium]|nr:alpha-L-rhamnosidase [Planctomycetota bacterium]
MNLQLLPRRSLLAAWIFVLHGGLFALEVGNLRCEHLIDPLGVEAPRPRLTWVLSSTVQDTVQTAWRIEAARSRAGLEGGRADFWDSGFTTSQDSVLVPWAGPVLASRDEVWWRVSVRDQAGATATSTPARFAMGLLKPGDWSARWIGLRLPSDGPPGAWALPQGRKLADPKGKPDAAPEPPAHLRRTFTVSGEIRQARLYVSALGVADLSINGKPVSDHRLSPGWSDFAKHVNYVVHDVTGRITTGENVLAAVVADGWYSGKIGWLTRGHDAYGPRPPRLLVQLEITTDQGVQQVVSDGSWTGAAGAIRAADLMDGEIVDRRLDLPGWDRSGFAATDWKPVEIFPEQRNLVVDPGVPVRAVQEIAPVAITTPKPGVTIFDLGQNLVGVARLRTTGPAGTVITLRFAEILDKDGGIYTANLRGARVVDQVILAGNGDVVFEPRFTFHGFRYVEVVGLTEPATTATITGVVLSSDTPATGTFTCSDPLVNQLMSNIRWGQRGNFLALPTDCPQRDERLGWMGDAQIFIRTASYNMDVAAFFTKWLRDVRNGQTADGAFPDVAPRVPGRMLPKDGAPAWGDAGVICPWVVWERYGDRGVLEVSYPSCVAWIERIRAANPPLIWSKQVGNNYGDWLSIKADTDKTLLATAFFANSVDLTARMAEVLGKAADAAKYRGWHGEICAAFAKAFLQPDGKLKSDTQAAYVLALRFCLLPEDRRAAAVERLVADIAAKGDHLSTGFLGVGHLMPVLADHGHLDAAYRLLRQDTFPSWGYSIRQGATTIWERWDGWTRDKGFQDPSMNSFNHYSLGSVGEWIYAWIGGIDALEPGYRRILIRPRPGGGIDRASASLLSPYGRIATDWSVTGGRFLLSATVPANTRARIDLPFAGGVREVGSGEHRIEVRLP